jgi:hypothetical protein
MLAEQGKLGDLVEQHLILQKHHGIVSGKVNRYEGITLITMILSILLASFTLIFISSVLGVSIPRFPPFPFGI